MNDLFSYYENVRDKRIKETDLKKQNTEEIIALLENNFDDVLFDAPNKKYLFESIMYRITCQYDTLFDYNLVRNYLVKRMIIPIRFKKMMLATIVFIIGTVSIYFLLDHDLIPDQIGKYAYLMFDVIWTIIYAAYISDEPELRFEDKK